jgi:glycosyltransferase involved in cell wall biosynthesis
MKIALIGPGIISIPPPGWGAVEVLIWDYYTELTQLGHEVKIINKMRQHSSDQAYTLTPYCQDLIKEINEGNYDFVHLHYDCLYHILPYLTAKKVGITSHYPYIDNEQKHRSDGFTPIFNFLGQNNRFLNFMLAQKDIDFLIKKGANPKYIFLLENGIDSNAFKCQINIAVEEELINKTIYLGQVNERKGQHKYCHLQNIDIIGPDGNNSNSNSNNIANYKGSWTRNEVQHKLTTYGNLLLLSKGEADPLVVKEALMCGVGVVVNATSAKNLILNASASASASANDFITIIADDKMDDLPYIQTKINENRRISIMSRRRIREYAEDNFGWNVFIEKYVMNINI